MSGRLDNVLHSLRARSALAVVALLSFLATSAPPRRAWYVHEHGPDARGHVHAGDAERADDEWSRLLAESVAHRHGHGAGHRHGDHGEPPRAAADDATDGSPGLVPAGAASDAHAHWQAPFQPTTGTTPPAAHVRTLAQSAVAPHAGEPHPASRPVLRARAPPARTV
ncbi:MAG: hypothetical protein AB1689_21825 [Thermodesulfobacteriota bacterium]